jgi:hypothetical protein
VLPSGKVEAYEIWGFHGGENAECGFLCCGASVFSVEDLPTFCTNVRLHLHGRSNHILEKRFASVSGNKIFPEDGGSTFIRNVGKDPTRLLDGASEKTAIDRANLPRTQILPWLLFCFVLHLVGSSLKVAKLSILCSLLVECFVKMYRSMVILVSNSGACWATRHRAIHRQWTGDTSVVILLDYGSGRREVLYNISFN